MGKYLNDEPDENCKGCRYCESDGRCSSPTYYGAHADGQCEPEDRKPVRK